VDGHTLLGKFGGPSKDTAAPTTTMANTPSSVSFEARPGYGVQLDLSFPSAIGLEIVPEDADGVTHATLQLQRQLTTFPGLQRGLDPLKSWCDRISLLFNDLGRLTNTDQNQHICSHLDILIISYREALLTIKK